LLLGSRKLEGTWESEQNIGFERTSVICKLQPSAVVRRGKEIPQNVDSQDVGVTFIRIAD
jgi:hypothetical protein